ncbi:MAG: hydrolase [Planctomycetales bacterium]|nr:hydrolase [Planctomycetales bacterium]
MPDAPARSPELMSTGDTLLLVVDVQERLAPAIRGIDRVVWNVRRLIDGAAALGVPAVATEQAPKKLGATLPELAERLNPRPEKTMFSCRQCDTALAPHRDEGRFRVLLTGIETHVCVQQTALDLLSSGWRVYLAVDAVGSRRPADHETALRRMESTGVTLTTTEAALFEWCEGADREGFKSVSSLAKEVGPS